MDDAEGKGSFKDVNPLLESLWIFQRRCWRCNCRPFPDLMFENDRLTALLEFEGNESKTMLKQSLELMFGGFVSVTERMFKDHVVRGKYATPDEDLWRERISVPTTNANPEHHFGILDRLMKVKPKSSRSSIWENDHFYSE